MRKQKEQRRNAVDRDYGFPAERSFCLSAITARRNTPIGLGQDRSADPQAYPRGCFCRHAHAEETISSSEECVASQPSIFFSFSLLATRTAGSPGRRGPIFRRIFFPVTRSTASITSRIE